MISIAAKDCPELAKLTWCLYKLQPWLITVRRDIVRSSSGTQQGCRLFNPIFALTIQFIADKLKGIEGLCNHLFFMDDTALVGTPAALAKTTHIIANCIAEISLRLKLSKCHLHCLPITIDSCKSLLFPRAIKIHQDFNMVYLRAPIGDYVFVRHWLDKKLSNLTTIVSLLSALPHKHEATTLLRSTATVCRVVYLMRILPPTQISQFISDFDATLR